MPRVHRAPPEVVYSAAAAEVSAKPASSAKAPVSKQATICSANPPRLPRSVQRPRLNRPDSVRSDKPPIYSDRIQTKQNQLSAYRNQPPVYSVRLLRPAQDSERNQPVSDSIHSNSSNNNRNKIKASGYSDNRRTNSAVLVPKPHQIISPSARIPPLPIRRRYSAKNQPQAGLESHRQLRPARSAALRRSERLRRPAEVSLAADSINLKLPDFHSDRIQRQLRLSEGLT